MDVLRVFNNNVVLAKDGDREVILTGRGIGFQAKPGQHVDDAKIVRRFVPADGRDPDHMAELLAGIPPEIIRLVTDAMSRTGLAEQIEAQPTLVMALADHICGAIQRSQKGQTIEADGITYTPEMVLGPARKGIRLTYTTDTRPTESILRNAKESDLFICEGMYGEDDKADKARGYKHMTFREAAVLARDAKVQEMWLTHYSPSLVRPDEFMDKVREIFPNAFPGKDGKSVELNFEE